MQMPMLPLQPPMQPVEPPPSMYNYGSQQTTNPAHLQSGASSYYHHNPVNAAPLEPTFSPTNPYSQQTSRSRSRTIDEQSALPMAVQKTSSNLGTPISSPPTYPMDTMSPGAVPVGGSRSRNLSTSRRTSHNRPPQETQQEMPAFSVVVDGQDRRSAASNRDGEPPTNFSSSSSLFRSQSDRDVWRGPGQQVPQSSYGGSRSSYPRQASQERSSSMTRSQGHSYNNPATSVADATSMPMLMRDDGLRHPSPLPARAARKSPMVISNSTQSGHRPAVPSNLSSSPGNQLGQLFLSTSPGGTSAGVYNASTVESYSNDEMSPSSAQFPQVAYDPRQDLYQRRRDPFATAQGGSYYPSGSHGNTRSGVYDGGV